MSLRLNAKISYLSKIDIVFVVTLVNRASKFIIAPLVLYLLIMIEEFDAGLIVRPN